ncbi:MAG: type III-B CRISPR module RAMP protein Cmr4 [Anaerolineaceae bacterium]
MFEEKNILFLYVETPLHAGTGRGLGAVDLPIQRDRSNGYPIIQASSIKGSLRAEAVDKITPTDDFLAIFGPDTGNASAFAGALSCGDARILLFPVRSLAGVFAWITSLDVLARFERVAELRGQSTNWNLPQNYTFLPDECWINENTLLAGSSVVLEEFSFTKNPEREAVIKTVAEWLAAHALPQTAEYEYWRANLPKRLCILPENAFRDFVLYSTEIQTHVKLRAETKTVDEEIGGLWTSESLPVDSLFYAPLLATKSRSPSSTLDGKGILTKVTGLEVKRIQFGGDETTGQGIVAINYL